MTVTAPNGNVTAYSYDDANNLKTLTDGESNVTTWNYEDLNRVKEELNELGDSRYFVYDDNSSLTPLCRYHRRSK
jgi:YD repeat-containing protein